MEENLGNNVFRKGKMSSTVLAAVDLAFKSQHK